MFLSRGVARWLAQRIRRCLLHQDGIQHEFDFLNSQAEARRPGLLAARLRPGARRLGRLLRPVAAAAGAQAAGGVQCAGRQHVQRAT